MGIIMILLTKPFSLCKSVLLSVMQIMFIVIHTWVELVRTSINVHLNMFHKTMIWAIAVISLPVRVLTALQRERLLQEHLHELQTELDNLAWDRKELQHQLHTAIKECRLLETMLAEVEDENDNIFAKFELLECKLQDLKVENLQLKEILGKYQWCGTAADNSQNFRAADTSICDISDGRQSSSKASGWILEDSIMHKAAWEAEGKSEVELLDLLKNECAARGSIPSFSHYTDSRSPHMNEGLDERRDTALLQSLFSAALSLLVGFIIWNSGNPCVPLVAALFTVVGMSLKSVVQFFSTIKNKPASDAVALLSFNWFILGTLTYPALPRLAPVMLKILDWIVG